MIRLDLSERPYIDKEEQYVPIKNMWGMYSNNKSIFTKLWSKQIPVLEMQRWIDEIQLKL